MPKNPKHQDILRPGVELTECWDNIREHLTQALGVGKEHFAGQQYSATVRVVRYWRPFSPELSDGVSLRTGALQSGRLVAWVIGLSQLRVPDVMLVAGRCRLSVC